MSRSRRGLARTDTAVVVGLLALSGGLLLPTVQRVWATEAQASCKANLAKMGKAIHQYADAHGGYLPANTPDGASAEHRGSHVTRVLPYLGYEEAVRNYRGDLDWAHPLNAATVKTRLPFLHCPSAPKSDRWITGTRPDDNGGATFTAAPSDYVGVTGLTNALVPAVFPPDYDRTGAMPTAEPRRRSDIPDGTASTLIVVEIADKPNHWRDGQVVDVPATNEFGYGAWAAPANVNNPRGYSWDGAGFPGPCPMNCSNLYAVYAFHPGGSNILFADGSARFVKQSIDIGVFYALITRNGGEILAPR